MRMKLHVLISVLTLYLPMLCGAPDFHATLEFNPREAQLADEIQGTLTLTYPEGYRPSIPAIEEQLLSPSSYTPPPYLLTGFQIAKESGTQTEIRFTLFPILPGEIDFSFLKTSFQRESQPQQSKRIPVASSLIEIHELDPVQSIIPLPFGPMGFSAPATIAISPANRYLLFEGPQMREKHLKGNLERFLSGQFPWKALLQWGTPVALLFTIHFGYALLKTMTKGQPRKAQNREEILRRAIENIEQHLRVGEAGIEDYLALNRLIRTHLQLGLSIPAHHMTTGELLKTLSAESQIDQESFNVLQKTLQRSEEIKYRSEDPKVEDFKYAIESGQRILGLGRS